jgi:hypothetical protein
MFFGPLLMIAIPMVGIIFLAVLISWFVGDRTRSMSVLREEKSGAEYEERRNAPEA